MGMFTKGDPTPAETNRRLPDEPLDGRYGKTLPLLHRVFIRVLVSEIRKMLDERDVEREARPRSDRPQVEGHWEIETVVDGSGKAKGVRTYWNGVEVDGTSRVTGVDRGGRFTDPTYRGRTEQDG